MKTHELKCWPDGFRAVVAGTKHHEVRRDDRAYAVGDVLHLREWSPERCDYTGADVMVRVTHKSAPGEWGLPPDLCVLSIEPLTAPIPALAQEEAMLDDDAPRGLYEKFRVERADGSPRHRGCAYFVLDLTHDGAARMAATFYASAVERTKPVLSAALARRCIELTVAAEAMPTGECPTCGGTGKTVDGATCHVCHGGRPG